MTVEVVKSSRSRWPGRTVHVECETLDQVHQSLEAGADALLLDNMTPAQVRACVDEVRAHSARHGVRPLVEASGGITLAVVAEYAALEIYNFTMMLFGKAGFLQEATVIVVGHETDFHALFLVGGFQIAMPSEVAGVVLSLLAKRKHGTRQLVLAQ